MINTAPPIPLPTSTEETNTYPDHFENYDNAIAQIPETKVLAIASHVTYGYVGNTMATFVMQVLGCEVAAINTVNFSNHTGYRRFTGTRTTPEQITSLYAGLKSAFLTDFDVLLSGYIPSPGAVDSVAAIARDLRCAASAGRHNAGAAFFWILDPVMGDQGRLYVDKDIVGRYVSCVRDGGVDLVLPNGFEAELLTGRPAGSVKTLADVVSVVGDLHKLGAPHVVVTSVTLEQQGQQGQQDDNANANEKKNKVMIVAGSSKKTDGSSRVWKVEVPVLDCFFSGTGDMFAALMVGRLREAAAAQGLLQTKAWMPDDSVAANETPLAKATQKVLSSMQTVLEKTIVAKERELATATASPAATGSTGSAGSTVGTGTGTDAGSAQTPASAAPLDEATRKYLALTKASEIRLVRNWRDLVQPRERFKAVAVAVED